MPFPRPTLTALRSQAMQDVTASDLPNADGFLRRSALRVLAWVQAGLAYLHYGYMDWIALQSTPFTATGEYLEAWAALAPTPVTRDVPNKATGSGIWSWTSGAVPVGTVCTRPDGVQYVTTANGTVTSGSITIPFIAAVAGSNGNTDSGTPLTFGNTITGIASLGAASGPITGGTDLEEDPPMRTRMLESYAEPPHGGSQADYVTWAFEVAGITRAWCKPNAGGAGTVFVYFMMDEAESAHGGFPQGNNGVAALEPRDTPATGDQLTLANFIYPLQPVSALVYAVAPVDETQNFTISGLTSISTAQQAQVSAALSSMFTLKDSPLGTTSIDQSDCDSAITAIGGLPSFAITSPSSWPITSNVGSLFALGTVTYVP